MTRYLHTSTGTVKTCTQRGERRCEACRDNGGPCVYVTRLEEALADEAAAERGVAS